MSKKILSVMLAIMLVLSTFAVTAFAADLGFEVKDKTEDVILSTQCWKLDNVKPGAAAGEYTVDVSLTTNYVTGAISFRVDAANGAKLTGVKINEEVITYLYEKKENENGKVVIIPEPAYESDEGIEVNGVIATLTFKLADGTDGDTLKLVNDAKTETNPGGDLIAVRLSEKNLSTSTMICGQRVVDENGDDIEAKAVIASVNIGEVAAEPVLKGLTTGCVDTARKYVYGVPAGKDAKTFFTVENGSFEITGTFTGAVLTVKDAAGTAVDTYTLIIFGDVNGDGGVTATDFAIVKDVATGGAFDGAANNFAANVNGDSGVTATDFAAVKQAATGGDITVNPYAA